MRRSQKLLAVVLGTSILLGSSFAAADKPEGERIGKTAEIWLPTKTRFSGFALPPGQYLLQHAMEGTDHMMTFVQLRSGNSPLAPSTHKLMPVKVRCGLEPLPAKASQTAFYSVAEGDANRALRLEIKGENVAHIFPMPAPTQSAQ